MSSAIPGTGVALFAAAASQSPCLHGNLAVAVTGRCLIGFRGIEKQYQFRTVLRSEAEMKLTAEIRNQFEKDRFATENGAVIDEVDDHYAKCSLKIEDRHRNAMGAVMGGVYFTLADFALAVASNWQKMGTVSLNSEITYLSAAKGERLTAEAVCVKNGRTTSYYRIDVTDDLGNLTAAVTATAYKVSK